MNEQKLSPQQQMRANALREFGVPYDPSKRYRWGSIYDTQPIPAAAIPEVEFFNVKNKSDHDELEIGTNLGQTGEMDNWRDLLVVAYMFEFPGDQGSAISDTVDHATIFNYGQMAELWVNNDLKDRERWLCDMPSNRGLTIAAEGYDEGAAAFLANHVTNGAPGVPSQGLVLQPYEYVMVPRGSTFKSKVKVHGPAAVGNAVEGRLRLAGILIEDK